MLLFYKASRREFCGAGCTALFHLFQLFFCFATNFQYANIFHHMANSLLPRRSCYNINIVTKIIIQISTYWSTYIYIYIYLGICMYLSAFVNLRVQI